MGCHIHLLGQRAVIFGNYIITIVHWQEKEQGEGRSLNRGESEGRLQTMGQRTIELKGNDQFGEGKETIEGRDEGMTKTGKRER